MPRVPAIELRSTLLLMGMLAGVAAMGLGLGRSARALPPGIAAQVGEQPIAETEVTATLNSLHQAGFSQIDRNVVLDRMIDEELLLQEAQRLNLQHTDPLVRSSLVRAVIDANNAAARTAPPSDAELSEHYAKNPTRFAAAARLELEVVWFGGKDSEADALVARKLWASGQDPHGNSRGALPLPSGLVPVAKWREYLGTKIVESIARLPEGALSQPFQWDDAWGIAKVKHSERAAPPPLAEVKDLVRADFERQRSESRLRALLQSLRRSRDVRVAVEPR